MKLTSLPHNLVGGVRRSTLIRTIKYSSVGTADTRFIANGNLADSSDTQGGSNLAIGVKNVKIEPRLAIDENFSQN